MTVAPTVAKVDPVTLVYGLLGDGIWRTEARWSAMSEVVPKMYMEGKGQPLIAVDGTKRYDDNRLATRRRGVAVVEAIELIKRREKQ